MCDTTSRDGGVAIRSLVAADADVLRRWRCLSPELKALWPEKDDVADWDGVAMKKSNGVMRVIHLTLQNKGLAGDVPEEIGGVMHAQVS